MPEFEEFREGLRRADDALRAARRADQDARVRNTSDQGVREQMLRANAARAAAWERFAPFSDPRRLVSQLPDDTPFLLLPVRLETRFRRADPNASPNDDRGGDTLCVRIYPDECSVDAFDSALSVSEVAAAKEFWRGFWRAGGKAAEEEAAWAGLAGAYGGGRASWIVQAYRPDGVDARVRAGDDEIVLVIATEAAPTPAERTALDAYWPAVWAADGDAGAIAAARAAHLGPLGAGADDAIARLAPFNLADPPAGSGARNAARAKASWLTLPAATGEERAGWRRAPTAAALPERFVAIGYVGEEAVVTEIGAAIAEPLYLGPDPAAPESERIVPVDGKLTIPEPLKWLFDFDAAVAAGMGVRLRLTPTQAQRGFDRIVVLGVRLRDDAQAGRATLEELLRGHLHSRAGFALTPVGAATNNAEDAPSAYSRREEPALSYADAFGAEKFAPTTDALAKRDGQVLAEALGLDSAFMQRVRGADGRDMLEARAMNIALAPGTIGYMAGTMMEPVFKDWYDELLTFFADHVTGRGATPSIRIGAQPYGVVTTTAFSRMTWPKHLEGQRLGRDRFIPKLHAVLNQALSFWAAHVNTVGRVGDGRAPHATLLDVLGLHAASVEFHQRYGKSLDELHTRGWFLNLSIDPQAAASAQRASALALLRTLGYSGEAPDIADIFFRGRQDRMLGPTIEALPLSETDLLAPATTDGRSYLKWLAQAATESYSALRQKLGFIDDKPPNALLFIMLLFALERGYLDSSMRLRAASPRYQAADIAMLRREPKAVHLDRRVESESTLRLLVQPDQKIEGAANRPVSDLITAALSVRADYAALLADQIRAVQILAEAPTARLERAFVDHLDSVSYRYDAWRLGVVNWQLARMRAGDAGRHGVYLGAYGWLEDVRPKPPSRLAPQLPQEIAETFKEGAPLTSEAGNGGFIHAPSLNQAVTAAVLRAGDLASRAAGVGATLNLSSERVRLALSFLEGVRNGQSINALLGYRFERALHEAGGVVEIDALVFAFRRAFPLTGAKLAPTLTPPPDPSEAIEARNVVDGLALVQQAENAPAYPFGRLLPGLSTRQKLIVEKAVKDIASVFDAMSDLALAESVHQATQGNLDRSAAQLEPASTFRAPPDPDLVRTPQKGWPLTCRVGLEFDTGGVGGATPRALAQPMLDAWLARAMPPLNTIGVKVTWTDLADAAQEMTVTLADLGLAPIDALHLVGDDLSQGFSEIDDRIERHVLASRALRPDIRLTLHYAEAAAPVPLLEAAALVKRLRALALKARPLRASDLAPPSEGAKTDLAVHTIAPARLSGPLGAVAAARAGLAGAIAAGDALLGDLVGNRGAIISGVDARIGEVVERLAAAGAFGGARIGWGALYDWRREQFGALLTRVRQRLTRWDERLAACDAALAAEAAPGATDEDRITQLRAAERQVSTSIDAALDPAGLRAAVDAKKALFVAKRASIAADALAAPDIGVADRLGRCAAILPLDAFDAEQLTFADFEDAFVTFAQDMQALLHAAHADLAARETKALAAQAEHAAATDEAGRNAALDAGAKAVFGEGFRLIPTFTLPAEAAAAHGQAHAAFGAGALLAHARATLDDAAPLDTWLHGVARVFAPMRALEDATMLWEAFRLTPGALIASQAPYKANETWLGLDFPRSATPDGERLIYAAHAPAGFNPAGARCGLLIEAWNETVPTLDPDEPDHSHTTGVAFHFDRPSQEPPQAMLLVTPPRWGDGAWAWEDLTAAVIDTFKLAQVRAVEPTKLDQGATAQFLPATVASVTTTGLSIAANFALNNFPSHMVNVIREIDNA